MIIGGSTGGLVEYIIVKVRMLMCPMCAVPIVPPGFFGSFIGVISGGLLGAIVGLFIPSKEVRIKSLKELPPDRWKKDPSSTNR
jgi:hypothetical protein